MKDRFRLQAKFVLASPEMLFSPGQIVIAEGRILEVTDECNANVDIDLQDALILPGLINSHTHLEFSELSQPIPAGATFPDWIRGVLAFRRELEEESKTSGFDKGESSVDAWSFRRREAIERGMREAIQCGTTLLADIVTMPWSPAFLDAIQEERRLRWAERSAGEERDFLHHLPANPLQVVALPEIIGLTEDRLRATMEWAMDVLASPGTSSRCLHSLGLSPHAPYSCIWDEIERFYGRIAEPPLTVVHVAESSDELDWLENGQGAFSDSFQRLGLPTPAIRPSIDQAIDFLLRRRRGLLVHGNYLSGDQMDRLATTEKLSVVYCPRTHSHFGHEPYPLEELLRAGVNVAFGTDSRASNPDLNPWSEMVAAREKHPGLSPKDAFAAITSRAARALGCESDFGVLGPGKLAYVGVLRCRDDWRIGNILEEITNLNLSAMPLREWLLGEEPGLSGLA